MSKNVFIVANIDKPSVGLCFNSYRELLEKNNINITGVDTERKDDLFNLETDLILVLGGDGTIINTARRLNGKNIPILGVNFGNVGFLASFSNDDIFFRNIVNDFFESKLTISKRSLLNVSVLSENSIKCNYNVLNEIAVMCPFHLLEMGIKIGENSTVNLRGDGIIVSTPSGSTAYNVSAGGPILFPDVDAFCITPICPHSLSFRPIVVPSNNTVSIKLNKKTDTVKLICDGQVKIDLNNDDVINVSNSKNNVLLVEKNKSDRTLSLIQKLGWG